MALRITLTLVITIIALAVVARRVYWLSRLVRSGQPAPGRTEQLGPRLRAELVEVFGQRTLLKWSVPGVAHFLTFWGFVVLGLTIIEAYGALLITQDFHIPLVGRWQVLGFAEDFFAVAVLVGLITFAVLRLRHAPEREQRASRFYGSHTRAAWVILGMITLVIVTLLLLRGAQWNTGHFPFGRSKWTFASYLVAKALGGGAYNQGLETFFLLAQVVVVLVFAIIVVYSKHLHIALAPVNVATKRLPDALGPLLPVAGPDGTPVDFSDVENLDDDFAFGKGKIEDFTWKGLLDLATCTECGRCQDQCPAWHTGKPLSPKLVIMDLRDHLFAKAPYILTGDETARAALVATGVDEGGAGDAGTDAAGVHHHGVPESGFGRITGSNPAQYERPLVGTLEEGGVIDPDVLWSCTTCGACVEQCPVDIEHVDHIVDMRRYQVLVESSFPSEAGAMLRNLENRGNPWGLPERQREEWMADVSFDVRQVSAGEAIPDDVEYLYWVGCAGALEDRARKVTVAFAELLHTAGVGFAVLGAEEACSGDPARRLGNEFLFQMMGQQNVETLNSLKPEGRPLKIVATCPHCFNTLGREYPQLGGDYEVIHHTQLLAQLVADGHLTPVEPVDKKVTYHDPCYLGRHNKVYTPPRDVLGSIPALRSEEMHRCKERGFCCGAGGARFWMEEKIGKRINVERTDEALGLDPDLISTACPFCMVMLSDAVNAKKADGSARDDVAVLDVAQILQQSLSAGLIDVCRLFGLRATDAVRATFWLLDAPDSLVLQSRREPDGAGIGFFDDDRQPVVDKAPIAAWQDADFATEARTLSSPTFVAHVRYASTGGHTAANTHPFVQDGRIFAHNGAFAGLAELDDRLAELDVADLVLGQTDSERMFALITGETRHRDGDVDAGLVAAVEWITDRLPVLALNLIVATPDQLWALRYPETHELYVLERPGAGRGLTATSPRIQARSDDLGGHDCVVVASEAMDGEDGWRLLAPGELLRIDADLSTHSSFPFPPAPRHELTVAELDPQAGASQS